MTLLFYLVVISTLISTCNAAAAAVHPPSFALSSLVVTSSDMIEALSPMHALPPIFKPSFRISLPNDMLFPDPTSVVNVNRGGGGGIMDRHKNKTKKQQNKKEQHGDKKKSSNEVMTMDKKPTHEVVDTDIFNKEMDEDATCNREFLIRIGVESFLSAILIGIGEYQANHSNFATAILCRLVGVVTLCSVLAELATIIGEDAIKIVGAALLLMGLLLLVQM